MKKQLNRKFSKKMNKLNMKDKCFKFFNKEASFNSKTYYILVYFLSFFLKTIIILNFLFKNVNYFKFNRLIFENLVYIFI